MGHDHSAAAVSFATKLVHGITIWARVSGRLPVETFVGRDNLPICGSFIDELQISLPKVTNDLVKVSLSRAAEVLGEAYLATGKAAHRNNHDELVLQVGDLL